MKRPIRNKDKRRIAKSQTQTHTHTEITHFQGKMERRVKIPKEASEQSQREN